MKKIRYLKMKLRMEIYHSWKFQENSKSHVGVIALFVHFLAKFTGSIDIS